MFKRVGTFLLLGAVCLPAGIARAAAPASTGTWSLVSKTNIDFSTSGAKLTAQEQTVIAAIAKDLAAHPAEKVSVQGFADSTGTDKRNQAIASARAAVVAKALAALGVDSARFTEVAGEGASNPLGDNATEAGRRLNRRAEVRVLGQAPATAAAPAAAATEAATAVATVEATPAPTAAGGASAQPTAEGPQFFLNLDALAGIRLEPSAVQGHGIGGGDAGLEYIPNYLQYLGVDVDYSYLAVGRDTKFRDQDVNLSLRGIFYKGDTLSGWVQLGAGYNTTENPENDHVVGFVQPGLRWAVLPRLALDGGVRYLITSPEKTPMQAVTLMLGLTVPLDGSYLETAYSGK